jgi:hypothetical protein
MSAPIWGRVRHPAGPPPSWRAVAPLRKTPALEGLPGVAATGTMGSIAGDERTCSASARPVYSQVDTRLTRWSGSASTVFFAQRFRRVPVCDHNGRNWNATSDDHISVRLGRITLHPPVPDEVRTWALLRLRRERSSGAGRRDLPSITRRMGNPKVADIIRGHGNFSDRSFARLFCRDPRRSSEANLDVENPATFETARSSGA